VRSSDQRMAVIESLLGAILIARVRIIDRLERMGAKYLPTIKDLKASQRFQEKQKKQSPLKKSVAAPPAKPSKKK
jgi:hypothetical protein